VMTASLFSLSCVSKKKNLFGFDYWTTDLSFPHYRAASWAALAKINTRGKIK
jgi:hypothetical protein